MYSVFDVVDSRLDAGAVLGRQKRHDLFFRQRQGDLPRVPQQDGLAPR